MRTRKFDVLHLDVEAFAKAAGELEGAWPLVELDRLNDCADAAVEAHLNDVVTWLVRGELRSLPGHRDSVWLNLSAKTRLFMACQRCLAPVSVDLVLDRGIRFVQGDAEAAELDEEVEEDVLALSRSLNVKALIEDELLLGLPLVPRHQICPEPLHALVELDDVADAPNPFVAALAGLKGVDKS